jgi:hypothetical protein
VHLPMKLKIKDFVISVIFLGAFLLLYRLINTFTPDTGKWSFLYPVGIFVLMIGLAVVVSHLVDRYERKR